MVGIADKVPIGEELQLDDIPAQGSRTGAGRNLCVLLCSPRGKIYGSHIDISWVQYYKTDYDDEILELSPPLDRKVRFEKHTGLPHSAKACPAGRKPVLRAVWT